MLVFRQTLLKKCPNVLKKHMWVTVHALTYLRLWGEVRDAGLTLGWKAPCSELKGPECGSSGGMPGMVGGYEGKNWGEKTRMGDKNQTNACTESLTITLMLSGNIQIWEIFDLPNANERFT